MEDPNRVEPTLPEVALALGTRCEMILLRWAPFIPLAAVLLRLAGCWGLPAPVAAEVAVAISLLVTPVKARPLAIGRDNTSLGLS